MSAFSLHYKYLCPSSARFYDKMSSALVEMYGITQSEDEISFGISFRKRKTAEQIMSDLGGEFCIVGRGFICSAAFKAKKRLGLFIGAAVCIAAILILQSFVVNIEVLTDDEEIRSQIMSVLYDNGIGVGSYIPDISLVKLERELKQRADLISWAGISTADSTLIIDVIENIDAQDFANERMPSNLIASHSGVIEDVELYNGQLVKTIGSGVVKGETIVSGEVTTEKTKVVDDELVTVEETKYVRSIGAVYGTYTDTQTFEQSYLDTNIIVSPETFTKKWLSVFNVDIPLFLTSADGFYMQQEEYSALEFLGEQTPVGIKSVTYNEYSFERVLYTKEQALEQCKELMKNYEENFLSECEIKSVQTDISYEDYKAVLNVSWEVYGLMSRESQFFAQK